MPTHDLPLETGLILDRTQDLRRETEQLRDQIHDRLQEVEQTRHQTQGQPQEEIQQHDLQHVLRIAQHALIQARDQPDLRHVRALLLQQGQDQAPQHEAVEVAVEVAALHEEEIIRHK